MMTIAMLGAVLTLGYMIYYLSGYQESRVLKRKRNRKTAVGAGDQIQYFVDGNDDQLPDLIAWMTFLKFIKAYVSLPHPYSKVFFRITYTQIVTDGNYKADNTQKNKYGKTIYLGVSHRIMMLEEKDDIWIREVSEDVYNYRHNEIHPFYFLVLFPCGQSFYWIINPTLSIESPMLTTLLDNPLIYAHDEMKDPLGKWATKQQDVWVQEAMDAGKMKKKDKDDKGKIGDVVIDKMMSLNIDDPKSVVLDNNIGFDVYLDGKLSRYGIKTGNFSLKLGFTEVSRKVMLERGKLTEKIAEIQTQKRENELMTSKEEAKLVVKDLTKDQEIRDRQKSLDQDEKERLKMRELDLADWNTIGEKKFEKASEMVEKINKALGGQDGLRVYAPGNPEVGMTAALLEGVLSKKKSA